MGISKHWIEYSKYSFSSVAVLERHPLKVSQRLAGDVRASVGELWANSTISLPLVWNYLKVDGINNDIYVIN